MKFTRSRASFAVVGHPNKGKSSIVSTLAWDDSVVISSQSGTTIQSDHYRIDTGNSGFEMIDTPGFQRPKKVLHWLRNNATSADQRSKAIEKFIQDPECRKQFPDEVQLLTPLVEGAAILYVVDGSRPYGVEYEAEMEILRWTGRPSMALINPIENEDFIDSWKNALEQFFKIVRVFNPMQADFSKQVELLKVFSLLEPQWEKTLSQVIVDLTQQQLFMKQRSVEILAGLLSELCSYQYRQKVLTEEQAKALQPVLSRKYNDWMREKENSAFNELRQLYSHERCHIEHSDIELPPDLFDSEQWYAWGLNRKQLAIVSAMTGAVSGAAIDAAVAGHSFMLGAIGGSAIGFAGAWMGADKLVTTKVKGLPLGGYQACQGPIKNRNFPYVVIGRFIHLYQQLSSKNHADRKNIQFSENRLEKLIERMQKSQSRELHKACKKLVSQKPIENFETIIAPLFE